MLKYCILILIQICICFVKLNETTLTPKSPRGGKVNKIPGKVLVGPVDQNVVQRELVCENPSGAEILYNHQAYYKHTEEYDVKEMVLGYVTPWNNHGYEVAKIFANKFTHISPVWLQMKPKGNLQYKISGMQDIDQVWMTSVRKAGRKRGVKIVPRILFDDWYVKDYKTFFGNVKEMEAATKKLIGLCKKWKFDGLVIEAWPQLAARHEYYDKLVAFLQYAGLAFINEELHFIIVIPPRRIKAADFFSPAHFSELYDFVTAFSLMTYDYSNFERPGANSPVKWIEEAIRYLSPNVNRRHKILTGFNFYGKDYTPTGGSAIISHQYLELLKHLKGPMRFDAESVENYFEVKNVYGRHLIFYPTLNSVRARIELVKQLGTGVSIWELGQGLDYFYDLL